MSVFDWLANLPYVWVLAIAVGLFALRAYFARTTVMSSGTARVLSETADSLLFAWVVVFVILKPLFLQAFYIPSESMEPTLMIRDRLLVAKLPYWWRGPERGEILVFKAAPNADPDGVQRDYIKRMIGLPGDKLYVSPTGDVYINDKRIEESYTNEMGLYASGFGPVVIPDGHYFMMGDNRNHSADSRFWGPLDRSRSVGKAWIRFWPLNKVGLIRKPDYPGITSKPQPALGPVLLAK